MRYLKKLFQRQRAADRAFEERALAQLDRLISRAVEQDPFPLAHRADWEAAHQPRPKTTVNVGFERSEFELLAKVADEEGMLVTCLAHKAIMDWLATTSEVPPLESDRPATLRQVTLKFKIEMSEWARLVKMAEFNGLPVRAQADFALTEWLDWAEEWNRRRIEAGTRRVDPPPIPEPRKSRKTP